VGLRGPLHPRRPGEAGCRQAARRAYPYAQTALTAWNSIHSYVSAVIGDLAKVGPGPATPLIARDGYLAEFVRQLREPCVDAQLP